MTLPKLIYKVGIVACILLIISCFLPWAYYSDASIPQEAERTFTGFYSYKNNYGKPGKFLVMIGVLVLIFMLLPKLWAKRSNLFICALGVGYAIKSFVLYTSCYNAYCPEKKLGIYLMLTTTFVMLIASAFPNMKLKQVK